MCNIPREVAKRNIKSLLNIPREVAKRNIKSVFNIALPPQPATHPTSETRRSVRLEPSSISWQGHYFRDLNKKVTETLVKHRFLRFAFSSLILVARPILGEFLTCSLHPRNTCWCARVTLSSQCACCALSLSRKPLNLSVSGRSCCGEGLILRLLAQSAEHFAHVRSLSFVARCSSDINRSTLSSLGACQSAFLAARY